MDFKVEIELYEDENGFCPFDDFVSRIPVRDKIHIIKKNVFFEKYTYGQLIKSKYLEKVQGIDYALLELKYFLSPPYRMLCIIHQKKLVGLQIFKGSGSNGHVYRYTKQTILKAKDWQNRHPTDKYNY